MIYKLFDPICTFTDDTVTTLAIKYAIDEDIPFQLALKEICRRYPDCGFGGIFYGWVFSNKIELYNSWGSVPVAMRCFFESDSYVSFLRNVYRLDSDADTLACIGGGVAEEYYKGTGFDEDELLIIYLTDELLGILYEK